MRHEPFRLEPGRTIDRYQLLMPVAVGSASQVWAARLRGTIDFEKLVALRTFSGARVDVRDYGSRLLLEARLAARIRHPNVAQYLDLVHHQGRSCLIVEWLEGRSLGDLLRKDSDTPSIPFGVAVQIIVQACRGLQVVHELCGPDERALDWVHGDVSPDNLMIDTSGIVKLADLGISRELPMQANDPAKSEYSFVAPELTRGERVDLRADVFSLGAILYLLTTGRHPFPLVPGSDPSAARRRDVPAMPPGAVVRDYPGAVEKVVLRAISLKRERRFQSARAMESELIEAFPGHASEAELAEFLRVSCGDSIERERTQVNDALERFAEADSVVSTAYPMLNGTTMRNTLSPSYVTAEALPLSNAAPLRPVGTALAAAAMAFIAAFALTVVLAPSVSSRRSVPAARAVLSVVPVATQSARAEGTAQPSVASRERHDAAPLVPTSTRPPSSVPAKSAPAVKAPSSAPRKRNEGNAVLRRYGI